MTPSSSPRPGGHPLITRRHAAPLAALLLAAAAVALWHARPALSQAADAPSTASGGIFHPTPAQQRALTVETVRAASFENIIVTDGRIGFDAERATPVFSAHTGRVIEVLARAGDRVRRGQVLARLDAGEYAQGLNDLRSSTAQLVLTRSVAQRKRALLEARGASLQDLEQAEADLATAEAANAAARMRLRSLGASAADIERLSATGEQEATSGLASASGRAATAGAAALAGQLSAGATETVALIRAPIAGTITDRELGPGQFLQAGNATPLFTVSDTGSVWLWANVRESDAAHVRVGQRIEAELAALPGQRLVGRLDFVAAAIDAATHRLVVHATLDNHDGNLKPEMLATVRIHLGDVRSSPAVPESAVVSDGDGSRVWVVGAEGISAREVKLGRRSAAAVEVLGGLSAGERIVTRGALLVDAAGLAP